jgi:hypothetical protein
MKILIIGLNIDVFDNFQRKYAYLVPVEVYVRISGLVKRKRYDLGASGINGKQKNRFQVLCERGSVYGS